MIKIKNRYTGKIIIQSKEKNIKELLKKAIEEKYLFE